MFVSCRVALHPPGEHLGTRRCWPANGSAIVLRPMLPAGRPRSRLERVLSSRRHALDGAGRGAPCVPRSWSRLRIAEPSPRVTAASARSRNSAGRAPRRRGTLHQRLVRRDHCVEELLAVTSFAAGPQTAKSRSTFLAVGVGTHAADVQHVDDPREARAPSRSAGARLDALVRRAPWIEASVPESARSRSSMFTNSRRARPRSDDVPTGGSCRSSVPITPERTNSAPSTTRSAAIASPWNPGSPGASIRLIFRSCHSRCASDDESDICRFCSSSSQSVTVVPSRSSRAG